jgi:hypothetical protein
MTTIGIVSILGTPILAAGADDLQEIRSVLQGFNEAARESGPQPFRILFASR